MAFVAQNKLSESATVVQEQGCGENTSQLLTDDFSELGGGADTIRLTPSEKEDLPAVGEVNDNGRTTNIGAAQRLQCGSAGSSGSKPVADFCDGPKAKRPDSSRWVRQKDGVELVVAPSVARPVRRGGSSKRTESMYGRSPNSCNRHLKRSMEPRALAQGVGAAAVAGEPGVAEKAARAVQQANARVCLANVAAARRDASLAIANKRYKRLEADMIRSRIELVDTLSNAEKDRQEHSRELNDVQRRAKGLEVALRTADEVLQRLTTETKRKRCDAEEREAALRARISDLERRVGQSERECTQEKLATWGTIARETERAAGRERYRMAAFLQRYVLENEFLRASKIKAEESLSELDERLKETEKKLRAALASLEGSQSMAGTAQKALWAAEMMRRRLRAADALDPAGVAIEQPTTVTPQPNDLGGVSGGRAIEPMANASSDSRVRPTDYPATRAELAVQRLKSRVEGSVRSSGGGGDGDRRGRVRRGGQWGAKATAVRGEFRLMQGHAAELSFLLSATENERDSLASLLVLAERRMERMAVTQEELALKLAWGSIYGSHPEQQQQQQQQAQQRKALGVGGGRTVTGDAVEWRGSSQTSEKAERPKSAPSKTRAFAAPPSPYSAEEAATAEGVRIALVERLELRRRVRDLEILLKAAEAGAREVEKENRRLKSCCCWSSLSYGLCCRTSPSICGGAIPIDAENRGSRPDLQDGRREKVDHDASILDFECNSRGGTFHSGSSSLSLQWAAGMDDGKTRTGASGSLPDIGQSIGRESGSRSVGPSLHYSSPLRQEGGQRSPRPPMQRPEGVQQRRRATSIDEGSYDLIKVQLAWVLGLPADTSTEHQLLAEVMHLVVERGMAKTDAAVLEAQLAKMDAQALFVTRLAASTSATAFLDEKENGGSDDDRNCQRFTGGGGGKDVGAGKGRNDLAYGGSGCRLEESSLISSLSRDGDGGGMPGTARTTGQGGKEGGSVADGPGVASGHTFAGISTKNAADLERVPGSLQRGISGCDGGVSQVENSRNAGKPSVGYGSRGATDERHAAGRAASAQGRSAHHPAARRRSKSAKVPAQRVVMVVEKGSPMESTSSTGTRAAAAAVPATAAGTSGDGILEGEVSRASFPRTLQGRVVSIDIFCVKVPPEPGQTQETEEGSTPPGKLRPDDDEYELKVKAYDPAVLKHHTLNIHEDDIRRCFLSRPHLYTLGPHRRRVHQSLADRLVFMSVDDVKARRNQNDGAGGSRGEHSPPSALPTDGPTSGSRPSGRSTSGSGQAGEPQQLLVLVGDAGEIVLAEKIPDEESTCDDDASRKAVHRFAKSAIKQIKKEEETVEGVVYQYEAPLQEEVCADAVEKAKRLITMESDHSSQEDYDEDEEDEDEDEDDEDSEDDEEDGDDDYEDDSEDDEHDEEGEGYDQEDDETDGDDEV